MSSSREVYLAYDVGSVPTPNHNNCLDLLHGYWIELCVGSTAPGNALQQWSDDVLGTMDFFDLNSTLCRVLICRKLQY
jgi:hypothetical protein